MLPIGLNHMTVPHVSAIALIDMAARLGCVGIELRNDLGRPLFDGGDPAEIKATLAENEQRLLAIAEVPAFNEAPRDKAASVLHLIQEGSSSGAEGIALIPKVAGAAVDRAEQRTALRDALIAMQPMFEDHGMRGLIEPLGFTKSTLRFQEDVVAILDELGRPDCFAIIHDTFHYHLGGGGPVYPELTAVVHISGVVDPGPQTDEMTDAHRVLIDADDRLRSVQQLKALRAAGYDGPASFEAFAPEIHDMTDPTAALAGSIAFITSQLTEVSAVQV